MADNPYLAHLPSSSSLKKVAAVNGNGTSNGASSSYSSGNGGALDGFIPRKVGGAQCLKAMVSCWIQKQLLQVHRRLNAIYAPGKLDKPFQWQAILAEVQGHHGKEEGPPCTSADG
jgi:hypothetical protein